MSTPEVIRTDMQCSAYLFHSYSDPGRVPAGCGLCFETSLKPPAWCASAGHEFSQRVFNTSCNSLSLLADTPEPLTSLIIDRPRFLHTLRLRPRGHTARQHVSQTPHGIGESRRHRGRAGAPLPG